MHPLVVFILLTTARGATGIEPLAGGSVGWMSPENIERPGKGWPGPSAAVSHAAWPGLQQPLRLRYWPQLGYKEPNRTLLSCWRTIVLHDTANGGWPGRCINLARMTEASTEEQCRYFCAHEPRCAVWQLTVQSVPAQCWVGYGTHCTDRRSKPEDNDEDKQKLKHDITVGAAQRILHGDVEVLRKLRGFQVLNLYNLGLFYGSTEDLSIQRCKAWCYSSISCQYWQYSQTAGGCYVDAPMFSTNMNANPENIVEYPLTLNGIRQDSRFEHGEYLTHYCPTPESPTNTNSRITVAQAQSDVSPEQESPGMFNSAYVFTGCLAIGACIALAYTYGAIELPSQAYRRSRQGQKQRNHARESNEEEDRPLMNTPSTLSSAAAFPANHSQGRAGDIMSSKNFAPPAPTPPPPASRPPASDSRGEYGPDPAFSARGIAPPTQLVDFSQHSPGYMSGRQSHSAMAPTQLLAPGMASMGSPNMQTGIPIAPAMPGMPFPGQSGTYQYQHHR